MYSIMEAVEAAQRRTEERDRLNQQRLPVVSTLQPMEAAMVTSSYDGGSSADYSQDTRTEHQKYQDAIDANQYVGMVPVVGPILGMANDAFIERYEQQNPNRVVGGPNKFSAIGRIQGKGLTVEEQLAAKGAGLGLGKTLGFGDQAGQPGYTLMDRVFGTTPMNVAKEGDYIGVFPSDSGGDSHDFGIGGYQEEDLSYDSFAGPTGYA